MTFLLKKKHSSYEEIKIRLGRPCFKKNYRRRLRCCMSVWQDGQERLVAKVEIDLVCERCRKFCFVVSFFSGYFPIGCRKIKPQTFVSPPLYRIVWEIWLASVGYFRDYLYLPPINISRRCFLVKHKKNVYLACVNIEF